MSRPAAFQLAISIALALPSAGGAQTLAADQPIQAFDGNRRAYLTTAGAGFTKGHFQAEVTVTVASGHGGSGCAFFGLGRGQADPGRFDEPSAAPVVFLRLAPSDFAGGMPTTSLNDKETAHPAISIGDGTHRLRLTWDAANKRAAFAIDKDWNPNNFHADTTMALSATALDFDGRDRLFVGGACGVRFSNFTARPATDADLAALPVAIVNDPTAGTWLAPDDRAAAGTPEAAELLKPLAAALRPLACWYDGSKLAASRPFDHGRLSALGTTWSCSIDSARADSGLDLTLTFRLEEGVASSAGVAAAFDFSNWSTANYVMLPAAVYNGNRFRTVNRGYNAGLEPADHYRKDLPLTQGELPRLRIEPESPSKLEVNSCNVTTPAVCILDPRTKHGFILLTEQAGRTPAGDFIRMPGGEIIDNAFAIEESADRRRATVVAAAPGVRERKPEFVGFSNSPDRGIALKAGDSIRLKLRIYAFPAADIPSLLDRFMTVRKSLTGPNAPRKLIPASQVTAWMSQRIDGRFLQQGEAGFYCPENGPWIAFGWIGGWINTFPMLALGDAKHLERVASTFDFGLKAQEPGGYFHYAIDATGNVTFRDPAKDMNLARTSGDMLFWMIKQFQLLKAQGRDSAIKPEWEAAMRRLADAMVATWNKDGQWGKLINVKTGRVGEFNTTGGATIIGALAAAADYYHHPDYLKIARQAADYYYQRDFVTLGQTSGGCADILQNADSETAAGFMTSLMTLYEITGDKQWLEKSRNLANLVATWTVSHDYQLPKSTELGALGAKLAGVYWASTQNKHGAPGICTSSGDALFRIYRATGDARYSELLRDIVAAHGESIRPGGFTNERLTFCDADSRGSRGNHVTGWNETNGALMAIELPGIYLRTDVDRCIVFDAVHAKVVSRDPSGVELEITNPTRFDAAISILAETASQAAEPLGFTGFLNWPKVTLKAGQTTTVAVTRDGIPHVR